MKQTTQRPPSKIATKRWLQLVNPDTMKKRLHAWERIRYGQKNWSPKRESLFARSRLRLHVTS